MIQYTWIYPKPPHLARLFWPTGIILGRSKTFKLHVVGRIDPCAAELLKIDDGNSTNPRVSIPVYVIDCGHIEKTSYTTVAHGG